MLAGQYDSEVSFASATLGDERGEYHSSATKQASDQKWGLAERLAPFRPLLPGMMGLMLARSGQIIGSYGSYTNTDEGIFTDGSLLVAVCILAIGGLIIARTKMEFSQRCASRILCVGIIGEAAMLLALAAIALFADYEVHLRFIASCALTLFASLSMISWLRWARGSSNVVAVVYTFGPMLASEVFLFPFYLMPTSVGWILGAALILLQFPCMTKARRSPLPQEIDSPVKSQGYFGVSATLISHKTYLVATAIGVGLISVAVGFLRGYPDGDSIPFTLPTRILYALLTIVFCAWAIRRTLYGHRQTMTMFIWILLYLLSALALFVYAVFPNNLEYGAVITTTLNALIVPFVWYIIIAFESSGWRDPYYYAFAGWAVCWGGRSLARITFITIMPLGINTLEVCAAIGVLLVISMQAIFAQFIRAANLETRDLAKRYDKLVKSISGQNTFDGSEVLENSDSSNVSEQGSRRSRLIRLMGLDDDAPASLSSMRQSAMESSAKELGRTFMLSEREVEIVTLYALGFTQKRVAEKLFISSGTVHAHIKRIYQKTGLHSRQELIDYLEHYTS